MVLLIGEVETVCVHHLGPGLDEVLGESYVEELEEREEWVDEEETEARVFLSSVLEEVSDDYWEDEHWDEVDYTDDYFEEVYV